MLTRKGLPRKLIGGWAALYECCTGSRRCFFTAGHARLALEPAIALRECPTSAIYLEIGKLLGQKAATR